MQLGLLFLNRWGHWSATHLNQIYRKTILSIILHRAKLGYCGSRQRNISSNLLSTTNDPHTLIADLENQIE